MRRAPLAPALGALASALLAACGSSTPATPIGPAIAGGGAAGVYAAIGASETVGAGIDRNDQALRFRDTWPQLFFNQALPRATTYFNFGMGGITTSQALTAEIPPALAVHPTVATVWLNVDDLVRGVTAASYETDLDTLVHDLRQGGSATVLVANTPWLDHLPAYLACRNPVPGGPACLLGGSVTLPGPDVVNSLVDDYNAAIARVVRREGAVLVDLHSEGEVVDAHPDWVSGDGFHPSALGYFEVARLFSDAYARARAAS
ncbi:MAG TPA: SGNH/GDSL hydrolase family protein [Candidatus Dormibacteraeota bacterium]|nr:SGNH/GDSL hydrolase family protein [Candidatus Dormibacteraeota bacterium]